MRRVCRGWKLGLTLALTALLLGDRDPVAAAGDRLRDVIDREIAQRAGGELAPLCSDAEFLRRVSIDLTGMPPTVSQARVFLADSSSGKRAALIDRLLAGKRFPLQMAEALSATLLERRSEAKVPDQAWRQYLAGAVADDRAWSAVVGELIFTEVAKNQPPPPAARFFLAAGRADMHQKTRDVARLFLGRDIQCAQCHDHPTVGDFSQNDYFGLLTFLQETSDKAHSEFESVFVPGKRRTGPRLPEAEEVAIPKFTKEQADEALKHRPRLLLASHLPRAENRLFTRNAVNRFWHLLMGRGLVHPLDMHHSDNPPSHPELLDALAERFAGDGFRIKGLVREIVNSQSYQRSGRFPDGVEPDSVPVTSYRVAIPKPLSPEQVAWSVVQVSGNLPRLEKAAVPEESAFTYKDYLNGRIDEPPNNLPDVMKLFIGVFGNPPGEAEVEFSPAMGQALFLMNERMVLDWLRPHPGNLVERLVARDDAERMADELYLAVLTRFPTEAERGELAEYLKRNGAGPRRAAAVGELAWALISSAEFRLNH